MHYSGEDTLHVITQLTSEEYEFDENSYFSKQINKRFI